MKTVQNIEKVTVKVSKNELLEGKYIHCKLLSEKLGKIEEKNDLRYKSLRSRFYNSCACNKYNMTEKAGLKLIDVENPMLATASLELTFEVED